MRFAARDQETLREIVAMLVAIALLAERAAGRAFPVRWLVLVILRRVEAVAWTFLLENAPWHEPLLADEARMQGSPADAAVLALRLRLLAALMEALLPPPPVGAGWRDGGGDPARGGTPGLRAAPRGATDVPLVDTS